MATDNVVTLYLDPNSHVVGGLRALADSIECGETAAIDQMVIVATDALGDISLKMLGRVDGVHAIGLLSLATTMTTTELLGQC